MPKRTTLEMLNAFNVYWRCLNPSPPRIIKLCYSRVKPINGHFEISEQIGGQEILLVRK